MQHITIQNTLSTLTPPPPPGKTPQRRDFSYPQQLARTKPHSELLRDFQPCITLPPLPESDGEGDEQEVSGNTNTLFIYSYLLELS